MSKTTATILILLGAFTTIAADTLPAPGTMETTGPDGEVVALTLQHTKVTVEVSAFVAHTRVEQTFSNPFPEPIEVVYKFPLSGEAAVDDFEMQIGERVVVGEVHERAQARRVYQEAKVAGHQAAILEQVRENLFVQSVANLQPGEDVVVRIRLVELLHYETGSYEYRFPLVLKDRYGPDSAVAESPAADGIARAVTPATRARARDRLNPARLPEALRPGNDVEITVDLDAAVPVRSVRAVEHTVYSTQLGPTRARVELAEHDRIPNKDFILRWDVDAEQADVGVLTHRSGVDGYVALQLQPRGVVSRDQAAPKEILLVIDSSGSMGGQPIETAKRFANQALTTLGPRDTFNLIQFAGSASAFRQAPVANDPETVRRALGWVGRLSGNGGTEMLEGLKRALEQPDAGRYRMIVFLTDGQIGAEAPIIETLRQLPDSIRVFTVGIGSGVNDSLLSKMADVGGGVYTEVVSGDTAAAIDSFRGWVTRPYLTDIEIDWAALPVGDFSSETPRDLFSGQNLNLIARYFGEADGQVTVRGRLGGEPWEQTVDVHLPETSEAHTALAAVWARRRIDALLDAGDREAVRGEVIELAIEHRLMSPFTSFVAVDLTQVVERAAASVEHPHSGAGSARATKLATMAGSGITVLVTDAGGPLPGSMVTISHPQQRVQPTSIHTGADGMAEFSVLPPGHGYIIDVEFPGFGTRRVSGVHAVAGVQSALRVELASEISEKVVVTTARNVVDLEDTSQTTTFSDEFIQDLPVAGRFYQNVMILAPGVQDADGDGNPNVHGSRQRDFKAVVGGISNVDPLTGGWMSRVNPNSIEEMQVISAGATVEFGRAQGGFARIIQKQGSNDHQGALQLNAGSDLLDGNGAGSGPAPDTGGGEVTADVSGPIVKDRLWFRVSGRWEDRDNAINVLDGFETLPVQVAGGDAQLTWQAMPRNKLALKLGHGGSERGRYDTSAYVAAASAVSLEDDSSEVQLTWTAPYSPKILIESRVSIVSSDLLERPADPDAIGDCAPAGLRCIDVDSGAESGPFATTYSRERDATQLRSDVTVFAGRFAGATHTFRFGLLGERQTARARIDLAGTLWRDAGLAAAILREAIEGSGSRAPADGRSLAFYFEDQLRIREGLHINLGLRHDRRQIESNAGDALSIEAGSWTPQLSVAFDPWNNGKTSFSASARRYYHEHPVDLILWEQQPRTLDRITVGGASQSVVNTRFLDRGLGTPHQDEWTVAFEREIFPETRLTLRWVSRRMEDQYRVHDTNRDADGLRLDPTIGASLQLDSSGTADHDAITLEVQRRQYRSWELQGSYTWADASTDGEAPAILYGDERDLLAPTSGPASWISRHTFVVAATFITPWSIRLGGRASYASGLPFSLMDHALLGDSSSLYPALAYTEARNARTHDRILDVDLKLQKDLNVSRSIKLLLSLEALNVLGDDALVVYNPRLELGRRIGEIDDAKRRFGRHYRLGVTLQF